MVVQHAVCGAGVRAQRQGARVFLAVEDGVAPFGDGEVEGRGAHFGEAEGGDRTGGCEEDGEGGEVAVDGVEGGAGGVSEGWMSGWVDWRRRDGV